MCKLLLFVQILLHDPKDKPMMLQRGFKASPGFLTQVAVKPTYVSHISNHSLYNYVINSIQ